MIGEKGECCLISDAVIRCQIGRITFSRSISKLVSSFCGHSFLRNAGLIATIPCADFDKPSLIERGILKGINEVDEMPAVHRWKAFQALEENGYMIYETIY
jgi:hypothetical protein